MSNVTALKSPTGPDSMLQQLPGIVLDHLARVLASSERKENLANVHLALAAPVFYAPCIRVAIRTTLASFDDASVPRRDPNQADVVKLTPSSIGKLVYDKEIDQWYLVLPLRNSERTLVEKAQGDAKVDTSCGKSVMDYLNNYDKLDPSFRTEIPQLHTVPSFCQRLVLSGNVPLHLLDLPMSLVRLEFAFDAMPPIPTVVPDAFDRLPRALRALTMAWDKVIGASLPLAPPLQSLFLECEPNIDRSADPVGALAAIASRLPVTLKDLTLDSWPIGDDTPALAALAQHLPPRITSLSLMFCHVNSADLEQFVWPATLRRLDLKGNDLNKGPDRLPHQLKELDLSANGSLSNTETEWIAELPPTLEMLSLGETCVSDRVVDVCDTDMSMDVIEALSTVIEVVLGN
ncbi:hypothetical protein GGF31_001825 [Allomyces arbusculus]|nr:hypothetical protein GGF31_001825 [Allomyces arbusculus]